jgi:hypothetical protein
VEEDGVEVGGEEFLGAFEDGPGPEGGVVRTGGGKGGGEDGAAFSLLVFTSEYRMKRVLGFLDPWEDALGKGYQLSHSLLAFGHGGWTGVGL